MFRTRSAQILVLLLVAVILSGAGACASTGIGKAVQAADVQKKLVEAAAVEFIKLHLKNDPRVTDAVYAQGKALYTSWAAGETALANSLAAWKAVSSAQNEQRLSAALIEVTRLTDSYLAFLGKFVDLNAVKTKVGGA